MYRNSSRFNLALILGMLVLMMILLGDCVISTPVATPSVLPPTSTSVSDMLRNCRATNIDCTPTDPPGGYGEIYDSITAIAIPASIGRMQTLYENERAIVYVNRDSLITHLDSEIRDAKGPWKRTVEEMKVAFEAGQPFPKRDDVEYWRTDTVFGFIIDSIGSSDLAVYDKLKESCVTTLKKRIHGYNCGQLCGAQFISIYLPDCAKLFQVVVGVS